MYMGGLIRNYFLMDWKQWIKITGHYYPILMKFAKLPVEVTCHLRILLAFSHTQKDHF